MARENVEVRTADGVGPATVHLPDGDGPWPAVVMFPDAGGAREAMWAMADRLAEAGYVVLVPDTYYRSPGWAPFDVATLFGDDAERARLGRLVSRIGGNQGTVDDSRAWAEYLLSRADTTGSAIGTTGYCMGGRMSLLAAGGLGEQVAAAASFHGGRIAVPDDPSSPHLAAARIAATVYVAGAVDDGSFTAEQADLLERVLTEAGVEYSLEMYPAHHGFAVTDNPTYDETASERHWRALESLYAAALPR